MRVESGVEVNMRSIGTRLVLSFMLVVVVTVVFLEALIIGIIRDGYYKNLEANLLNQVRVSADLYYKYFSDSSLHDNVLNNVDTFWKQASAQVEIIDSSGRVLMDSIGIIPSEDVKMVDVEEALEGRIGKWTGRVDYDEERVMAVSYPLKSGDKIIGVLRFVSSLREVNKDVGRISRIILYIGAVVIIIFSPLSLLLAKTIIDPLREVTGAAREMASGNFEAKVRKRYNDEIGRLSDTLNYMAGEILKKDQLKNEFISSVSHELRTPLTSIKGWAVTLKNLDPADRKTFDDGLGIIEKESDRLTSMVEELLDFSRFVSGNVTINKERVNIKALLEHIHKQLAPRAQREEINFTVSCEDGLPYINTDENRLKQVFINILDNSFKFTPAGGKVTFTASCKGKSFVFYIGDTGCGITSEELPRIKEKFYKGRNSKSRNGIGLSICDEIIKLMGGAFEIRSEVNKGTETFITIPLDEG